MSLNLLLGFTGQLSLSHIAFFGIGAYVSALTSLGFDVGLSRRPPHCSRSLAADCGLCAGDPRFRDYAVTLVGRLSFRVRGAYFVIVTISFAEVVRLVALNWVELDAGSAGADQHPLDFDRVAGRRRVWSCAQNCRTITSCSRWRWRPMS